MSRTGRPCSHPREVSEPLSQICALAASWIRELTSRYDVPAVRVAPRPMPTSTSRCTSRPRRHENRYSSAAVTIAPVNAASGSPSSWSRPVTSPPPYPLAPEATITNTAAKRRPR